MSPQAPPYGMSPQPPPYGMSPQAPPYGMSPEPPPVAPSFPSHFAPPTHAVPQAPVTTARNSKRPRPNALGESQAPGAISEPLPPPTPAAVLAASMFLGVPLALATLVVAVLALR
jgi:hypothetical protein